MPGTGRSDNIDVLSDYFEWKKISTGKILRDHIMNKGPYCERIQECFSAFQFGKWSLQKFAVTEILTSFFPLVDDEIVVELVKKEIDQHEKKS